MTLTNRSADAAVAELLRVADARRATTVTRVALDPYSQWDNYSELSDEEATFRVVVGWVENVAARRVLAA